MGTNGGNIGGINVLVSDQLSGTAVLADASQIAAANEGLVVNMASHATVDLNAGGSPSDLTSLWQTNCRGIRVERWWAARVLRAGAVASLSSVDYSSGNSPCMTER